MDKPETKIARSAKNSTSPVKRCIVNSPGRITARARPKADAALYQIRDLIENLQTKTVPRQRHALRSDHEKIRRRTHLPPLRSGLIDDRP
jgi:hypothetical protein